MLFSVTGVESLRLSVRTCTNKYFAGSSVSFDLSIFIPYVDNLSVLRAQWMYQSTYIVQNNVVL